MTGGEASSTPTNWPAPVTFPRCAQIADQRSGRWHTTDGARGKAAMAFFSENLHGHPQSEGCDTLCDSVTQGVATSGRTILYKRRLATTQGFIDSATFGAETAQVVSTHSPQCAECVDINATN